jgi:DNA-binding PucR family transcriptional regulator
LLEVADTVADGELAADSGLDLTIAARIGEQHCRSGRELRDLIHAYRIAARVGWRHISAVALQFGVSSGTLATLAEAVFFFVDQLASASSDGFVREQAEWAAQRERAREELADLLLSDHASATAVQATAARADWRMPTTGAVVLARNASQAEHALMRLDPACLPIRTARFCGVVLPDPAAPGRRALLTRTLAGLRVVVGAAVPLQLLPESARVAETGLQLVESDVLPHRPLFIDDHLDAVIVHSSPALLGALRRQCLAPLDAFTESSRDRLVETLVAWLCHQGDRQRIAAALHIHPQTVRYRVARLREVFGETLETPAGRARLTLALCWGAPGPAPYPAPPPDTQGESR